MSQDVENKYKQYIIKKLSPLFHIKEEVDVINKQIDKKFRLDILLSPKEEAIKLGLEPDLLFGIEVKDPETQSENDDSVKKLIKCVMQAHSYTNCKFNGKVIRFVAICPDVDFFYKCYLKQKGISNNRDYNEGYIAGQKSMLRRLMQELNVPELIFIKDQNRFEIRYNASYYFCSKRGRSNIRNLGENRRYGSYKTRR